MSNGARVATRTAPLWRTSKEGERTALALFGSGLLLVGIVLGDAQILRTWIHCPCALAELLWTLTAASLDILFHR
jgi:hypothetical protein